MVRQLLKSDEIFTFGSNLAGRHGAGAALRAKQVYGAKYGIGIGRMGQSYAIPTKDHYLNTLPINVISNHVDDFYDYVKEHPQLTFYITRIGCGLAGYDDRDITELFICNYPNIVYDKQWEKYLPNHRYFEGEL